MKTFDKPLHSAAKPLQTTKASFSKYRELYMSYVTDIQGDGYLEYEQLFQRCIHNPGGAKILDRYIALRCLRDGYTSQEVALMLMQSPYVQQSNENQEQVLQYVEETIADAQRHFQQPFPTSKLNGKIFASLGNFMLKFTTVMKKIF